MTENTVVEKVFGKQKVYVINQDLFPEVNQAELKELDLKINEKKMQLQEVKDKVSNANCAQESTVCFASVLRLKIEMVFRCGKVLIWTQCWNLIIGGSRNTSQISGTGIKFSTLFFEFDKNKPGRAQISAALKAKIYIGVPLAKKHFQKVSGLFYSKFFVNVKGGIRNVFLLRFKKFPAYAKRWSQEKIGPKKIMFILLACSLGLESLTSKFGVWTV